MENKYLYIDDDNHENAVEKIDGFLSENLKIDTVQHSNSWEEQLKYIQNHSDDIDGLILDLKLDDCLNENKKRATFRGSTLAQEIRSRQKENLIKQMPIILFSANDKVKSSLEKAGIDIFDLLCRSAALLPLSPLRTVRATFTAYSSDNSKFNSHKIKSAHNHLLMTCFR